jgi:hypothetical protein
VRLLPTLTATSVPVGTPVWSAPRALSLARWIWPMLPLATGSLLKLQMSQAHHGLSGLLGLLHHTDGMQSTNMMYQRSQMPNIAEAPMTHLSNRTLMCCPSADSTTAAVRR